MPLTPEAIAVVKATAPVVAENALAITSTFYGMMFENNPEVLAFFNKSHQKGGNQPRALADAVIAYALHIDDLAAVVPLVEKIAHRHCALSVKPEHYGIVHKNLMAAIAKVLGDAVTPEIAKGWSDSVLALAEICIAAEEDIYKMAEARKGGWRYEREFEVSAKDEVAEDTIRFQFTPTGEAAAEGFEFTPGQYLTVRLPNVGAPRHYTLVSKPGALTLEVATRLVQGGEMSTEMHQKLSVGDKVLLGAPMGIFTVPEDAEKVVLVSAGIGVTPMFSYLNALPEGRVVAAAHVDKSAQRHAFREAFEAAGLPLNEAVYSSEAGHPDLKELATKLVASAGTDAVYMMCGPTSFMGDMERELLALGVSRVESEVFGTGTVKTNADADAAAAATKTEAVAGGEQTEEKKVEGEGAAEAKSSGCPFAH